MLESRSDRLGTMWRDSGQDTFGDDLKVQDSYNYPLIDKESITSKAIDSERVNYIKKIRLETNFFNVFRNVSDRSNNFENMVLPSDVRWLYKYLFVSFKLLIL